MFEGEFFQAVINNMWFENQQDEGVKLSDFFNPISMPCFALILTVVSSFRHYRLSNCSLLLKDSALH